MATITINNECAPGYTINAAETELKDILPLYDETATTSLIPYTNGNKYIKASTYNSVDTWVIPYPLTQFQTNSNTTNFIQRGSFPQFKKHLTKQGPGTYTLSIISNKLTLKDSSNTKIFELGDTYFKDGVLPDRLFILLQAGGGGGGSAAGGTDYFPPLFIPSPTPGTDGGSGASGGYFAIVINTNLLKQSSSNFYTFVVGEGGAGGVSERHYDPPTSDHFYGKPGSAGGDSYIKYKNTLFLKATGGGGGQGGRVNSTANVDGGKAGDIQDGNGTSLSNGHDPSQLGTYFWWIHTWTSNWSSDNGRSFDYGKAGKSAGGSGGSAGDSSENYYIDFSKNDIYKRSTVNCMSVGGYSGGTYDVNSSGGSASFFGKGGNGGGPNSGAYGKDGDTGAGGGGARWYAYAAEHGGKGGDGFLDIWY